MGSSTRASRPGRYREFSEFSSEPPGPPRGGGVNYQAVLGESTARAGMEFARQRAAAVGKDAGARDNIFNYLQDVT